VDIEDLTKRLGEAEETIKRQRLVIGTIVKRLYDEFGIIIKKDWVEAVENGEHDKPLPRKE
jgi:hypothetical protein